MIENLGCAHVMTTLMDWHVRGLCAPMNAVLMENAFPKNSWLLKQGGCMLLLGIPQSKWDVNAIWDLEGWTAVKVSVI